MSKESKLARVKVYEALQKSSDVYEKTFAFNTLIAACMEALMHLINKIMVMYGQRVCILCLNLLEPIIPHVTTELSQMLFERENLGAILEVKEEVFVQDSVLYMVMIGGKKRTEIEMSPSASNDEILASAKEAGAKWLEGMTDGQRDSGTK